MREFTLKEKVGSLLLDLPRLMPALLFENHWMRASNRGEGLTVEVCGVSTESLGPWSNDIYAAHVFPWIGRRLMNQALAQWPIRIKSPKATEEKPEISFIIPHRGVERLPLLRTVIGSIFAQTDIPIECIVVEQNKRKEAEFPSCVRHIHLPHPTDAEGWYKSWAFNVGVAAAKADIVVCHDGDILVPDSYEREITRHLRDGGYEAVHLQRFLFCLGSTDTQDLLSAGVLARNVTPERVRQNWQGGTLAIRKDAFEKIGGYDERFVGWGGEDNEFYDRCRILRNWRFGYLPFVHLWHPPQAEKVSLDSCGNLDLLNRLLEISKEERIAALKSKKEKQLNSNIS
jgi:glycosyltransferase involved in cell wall biosynthesis